MQSGPIPYDPKFAEFIEKALLKHLADIRQKSPDIAQSSKLLADRITLYLNNYSRKNIFLNYLNLIFDIAPEEQPIIENILIDVINNLKFKRTEIVKHPYSLSQEIAAIFTFGFKKMSIEGAPIPNKNEELDEDSEIRSNEDIQSAKHWIINKIKACLKAKPGETINANEAFFNDRFCDIFREEQLPLYKKAFTGTGMKFNINYYLHFSDLDSIYATLKSLKGSDITSVTIYGSAADERSLQRITELGFATTIDQKLDHKPERAFLIKNKRAEAKVSSKHEELEKKVSDLSL